MPKTSTKKVSTVRLQDLANYDPALKLKQACEYAACSQDTLRRAIYGREIAVIRGDGRSSHIFIRLSELNRWLKRREKPASRVAP